MTMSEYLRLVDDGNPNCGELPRIRLSREEVAEVMAAHEPMVTHITKRVAASFPTVDRDDLASEVRLKLLKSAHTYDPYSGYAFITHAMLWAIHWAKQWAFRELGKGMKNAPDGGVPVQSLTDMEGAQYAVPDRRDRHQISSDFWERVTRGMSPEGRELVIALYRDGDSYGEAAERLGVDGQHLRRMLYRAVSAIRRDSDWLRHYLT